MATGGVAPALSARGLSFPYNHLEENLELAWWHGEFVAACLVPGDLAVCVAPSPVEVGQRAFVGWTREQVQYILAAAIFPDAARLDFYRALGQTCIWTKLICLPLLHDCFPRYKWAQH